MHEAAVQSGTLNMVPSRWYRLFCWLALLQLALGGSERDSTALGCRAILLDGFQKIGLRHRPLRQLYAHRLLMHTRAEDLSMLKSFLDDGADYHTAFKLLYSDFQVLPALIDCVGCVSSPTGSSVGWQPLERLLCGRASCSRRCCSM